MMESSTLLESASTQPALATQSHQVFARHRITSERYQAMVESGAFEANAAIFLWDGELVEKMTKGRKHSYAAMKLDRLLLRLVPDSFHVEHEQPVQLDDQNMPEPDLIVVRGSLEDFGDTIPKASDLALVVEVSDSSLVVDSTQVKQTYARCRIPEYWIVNVPARQVEVHREPIEVEGLPNYQTRQIFVADQRIPLTLDDQDLGSISVDDLFFRSRQAFDSLEQPGEQERP